MRSFAGAAFLLLLVVAGGGRAADPLGHRARGDLAIQARDVFNRYCAKCHTGSEDPGKSRLKLLDHAQVVGKKAPIPLATPGQRSLLVDLLEDGSMPPGNLPAPTADEIAVLKRWINAQAPEYPLAFNEDYVFTTIADELDRDRDDPDRSKSQQYVSFAHLVRDGKGLPDLAAAERELRVALALSSPTGAAAPLEPVDAAGTVFRFDLVKQEWWGGHVFELMEGRKPVRNTDPTRLEALIESEYPYGTALRPDEPLAVRLKEFLFFRGVSTPYFRGDWLSSALLAPGWAPRAAFGWGVRSALTEDVLALGALRYPKAPAAVPDGPEARPFLGNRSVAVPTPVGGRKPVPPLSAWYAGDVAPQKSPFALKADLVVGAKEVTRVKVDEPFALRVSCDKKAFFTLLMVQADGEVRVQEVQGGTLLQPGRERLLTPKGNSFVIGGINSGARSAVEHFVLFVSETELPVPAIVRSKHGDKYVWRFHIEPTDRFPFDPNAVVRKVIPIPVTRDQ